MTKVSILNTRPISQQRNTHSVFKDAGYNVIDMPCIEIKTAQNPKLILAQLNDIETQDTIIFTSQYAVVHAFKLHCNWAVSKRTSLIAVGSRTAELLTKHWNRNILVPKSQNSQGIIDLLESLNQVKTIHLITAANGRQKIQNFAKRQTITLKQVNVYQRVLPRVSQHSINEIENAGNIYVLATSVTTLENLKQLLPKKLWNLILSKPLVCASSRIAERAKNFGFSNLINVDTANPELIVQQLSILNHSI